ncbi:response regulator transcription factor [Microbacterium hominis]|uniref:response regulator transcription factor n=1 Tax=Microbacterium hominis TaxID=162426 RepID=UPI00076882AE|nr:response regulator transcription factor [Microbacterium hominis]KXC06024.1 two-component system response regulator [Microbacterium hominis]
MTAAPARIRVLIADDNRAVRLGMRLQLDSVPDILVVGEAANGADALTAARTERPDVVLMDLQMPGVDGIEATRQLTAPDAEHPAAVVVMTSFAVDGYVRDALDAGAAGYLLKTHDSHYLVDAIRAAARGEAVVSPRMMAPVLKEFVRRGRPVSGDALPSSLSPAERRVVSILASGVTSNEDIAAHLKVSAHTVRSQLQSAMRKTGVADRTQLALWAVRRGLERDEA